MKKLGKNAITLLLITTILLSLVPLSVKADIGIPVIDDNGEDHVAGEEITVEGDGITAGSTVNVYWDSVSAWDPATGSGLIGSTTAESDGEYDLDFDIPESTNGNHYVWVKDGDTGDTARSDAFVIETDVDLSSDSGLEEDEVTVDGTGFDGDADIAIGLFADFATAPSTAMINEDTEEEGDDDEDEFEFSTDENVLVPGSVSVTDGVETFTDDGAGGLDGDNGGDGDVNYVTGEIEVEFGDAPADGAAILVSYSYFEDVDNTVQILTSSGDSDGVGSFSEMVEVPAAEDMAGGDYELVSWDGDGNAEIVDFSIGAVIELDIDEGPVGLVVEMEGRGFDPDDEIDQGAIVLVEEGTDCYIILEGDDEDEPIEVKSNGNFDLDFVIPQVEEEDDYTIQITVGALTVEADFEVTALAKVTVTPEYGLQGEKVMVKGENFVQRAEEEVEITLGGLGPAEFETESDGTFEGEYTIPGVSQGVHDLMAEMDDYNIADDTSFKAGLIVVVATPNEVVVGEKVTFTGTGFSDNEEWNASFGDEEVSDGEPIEADGTFTYEYYVPTVDVGTYTVTFYDIDAEIEVTTEVEVTETTEVTLDPSIAPNEYIIIIEGINFKDVDGEDVEFELYNDTDDWDITNDCFWYDEEDDIYTDDQVEIGKGDDSDGAFWAWWEIYDDEELSIGTYTLMVSVDDDWVAEVTLEITSKTVTVSPIKSAFRIGDTVAFNIVNSFAQEGAYIEIEGPSGELYWETDELWEWVKVGTTERVPYYAQTAAGNPMILVSDAPLGTWSYTMYDDEDDEIASGSFSVIEAPEAVLEQRINELSEDIADVQDQIAGVQDQVTDAAEAADAATQAANEAKTAVQGLESVATSAKDAADDAKAAAEDAKDAATGIQTLVYVAIAGSVIAALAAIVSLMQISRRIAG
jgi:hypothetical protein